MKLDRDVDPQTTERLQFAYDYRNRLIKVEVLNGQSWDTRAEYFYDALNRRVRVKKPLTPATDTVYLYDGWQCIEEREFDGDLQKWTPRRQYVYGAHYLDELVAKLENSSLTFYLQDSNYNVVALADDEGDVIERYSYTPYGEVTITSPTGGEQQTILNDTHLFQGQRRDPETGLYYFKNRYYSPVLGRFLQRDPAEYKDGMNLYQAFGLSSTTRIDPYGLSDYWKWSLWDIIPPVGAFHGFFAIGEAAGMSVADNLLIPLIKSSGEMEGSRQEIDVMLNKKEIPAKWSARTEEGAPGLAREVGKMATGPGTLGGGPAELLKIPKDIDDVKEIVSDVALKEAVAIAVDAAKAIGELKEHTIRRQDLTAEKSLRLQELYNRGPAPGQTFSEYEDEFKRASSD